MKDIGIFAKKVRDQFSADPGLRKDETEVIKEFGEYFRSGEFNWDTFDRFLKKDYNKHWTGIDRNEEKLRRNFIAVKNAVSRLLDESLPIQDRIRDVIRGKYRVKYLNIAVFTAILLVSYPRKYAVWNGTSKNAVNSILGDSEEKFRDPAEEYERFSNFVRKIAENNGLTLWEIDWLWYKINQNGTVSGSADSFHWWIEKTARKTHIIPVSFNSGLGEALWSSETDKSDRDIYANMREVRENDLVIHLVMDDDKSIAGVSRVDQTYKQFNVRPGGTLPSTGKTKGFYVTLKGYTSLSSPIKWDDLSEKYLKELENIRIKENEVFYDKNMNLRQGAYLTSAPPGLVKIINDEYLLRTKKNLPYYEDGISSGTGSIISDSESDIPAIAKNIILHGPVGTGKTYLAQIIAAGIINGNIKTIGEIESLIAGDGQTVNTMPPSEVDKDKLVKVTFHQSYGYEDFIGGIRAKVAGGQIEYKSEPGIFKTICDRSRNDLKSAYVIIIDEINRGDISRIFGELITLIEEDKRFRAPSKGMALKIPNFDEEFSVPENVYIIGTMNDSDRSIALLDIALRRRFLFFLVPPSDEIIKRWISDNQSISDTQFQDTVIELFKMLNKKILETKGEDFLIGHAFFKDLKDSSGNPYETLRQIFVYKIIPLLKEIYYGRDEILYKTVLNGKFFSKNGGDGNTYYVPKGTLLSNAENFKSELKGFVGNTDAQS